MVSNDVLVQSDLMSCPRNQNDKNVTEVTIRQIT